MKRKNHEVIFSEEIDDANAVLVPIIDTSISSMLNANAPEFMPFYTGNIPDYSKKSLMELRSLHLENSMQIAERKTRIKDYQSFENSITEQNNLTKNLTKNE